MARSTGHGTSFDDAPHDAGEPDYYAILGLTMAASDDDIRQAYRSLAKRWHPDHYALAPDEVSRQAERRMRAINRAHDVLSDPARRHDYDRRYGAHVESVPLWKSPGSSGYGGGAHRAWRGGTYASHVPVYDVAENSAHASRRAENTNGAGLLFATLSVILAVAIGGRMITHTDGSFITMSIGLLAVLALLGLAAFFATEESVLARAATAYLEHEPRVAAGAHPRGKRRHTPGDIHRSQHPHDPHLDHDSPTGEWDGEPTPFEELVDEALASVPEQFADHMRNVVVRVKDEPGEETLERMGVPEGHTLLGLYEGVPLTRQGIHGAQPEVVTVFQGPIERYCHHDADRIRAQVRATVLHELAHHFGIDHDDMPEWVK